MPYKPLWNTLSLWQHTNALTQPMLNGIHPQIPGRGLLILGYEGFLSPKPLLLGTGCASSAVRLITFLPNSHTSKETLLSPLLSSLPHFFSLYIITQWFLLIFQHQLLWTEAYLLNLCIGAISMVIVRDCYIIYCLQKTTKYYLSCKCYVL